MLNRQRMLLRMLEKAGGRASKLYLMKWAFLLSAEGAPPSPTAFYEFLPYKYGPFSFTLYSELARLAKDGCVGVSGREVMLLDRGVREARLLPRSLLNAVDAFSARLGKRSDGWLVTTVYARYPWFSANARDESRRAMVRPHGRCAAYTVGYEGLSIDGFLDLLMRRGIRTLIDVRSNPVARRYGFHRSTLSRLCKYVDIDYVHVEELGVPSTWREGLDCEQAYARLFERYEAEVLGNSPQAIDGVTILLRQSPSALMCREEDPNICHRSRLARKICETTGLEWVELRTRR